jgi:hypothetical protein
VIVGWTTVTAMGVRLFASRQGRFFRDVVHAGARETIVYRHNNHRSSAAGRRDPYLLHRQHLEYLLPRRVGEPDPDPKDAA